MFFLDSANVINLYIFFVWFIHIVPTAFLLEIDFFSKITFSEFVLLLILRAGFGVPIFFSKPVAYVLRAYCNNNNCRDGLFMIGREKNRKELETKIKNRNFQTYRIRVRKKKQAILNRIFI